jgi:hypothetical protein
LEQKGARVAPLFFRRRKRAGCRIPASGFGKPDQKS